MPKSLRVSGIFALLVLLISLIAQAVNARPSAELPLPGKWVGQWQRTLNIENCTIDPCVTGVAVYTMPMLLRVGEGNTIRGGEITLDLSVEVKVAALGANTSCEAHGSYNVTGGSVSSGVGGLPLFDVTATLNGSMPVTCNGAVMEDSSSTGSYSVKLQATAADGSKVTGDLATFDPDTFNWGKAQMESAGATVTSVDTWHLTNTSPFLNALKPTYERYFLQGVAFENHYLATIDWNGNAPGKVAFTWDDSQSAEVAASGSDVDFKLDLGTLPAGPNQIQATAYTADGDPSISRQTGITIVPVPAWANSAHFAESERSGSSVTYKGKVNVPAEPITLPYFDLTGIPLVDGKWGVPPLQIPVELLATSAGGQSGKAPMKTKFELYLGGSEPEFKLNFEGDTVTDLQADALTIHKSQLKTTVPVFNKEEQVGLLDLVPEMRAVTNVPIVGDLTEAINGILSINGSLNINVDGLVDIGPNDAGSDLTITSGSIRPWIKAYVKFMINLFNLASAWVGGGGSGDFTLQMAPEPKWKDCHLELEFEAGARVAGLFEEIYTKKWPLNACSGTTMIPGKVFAAPAAPAPLALVARPAGWQPERSVLERAQINGIDQTSLVENASPEASPALAVGPENRLAFAWVSEDPAQPRLQSQEIALRLYDGSAWGETIRLTDNTTFDSSPAVAFDRAGRVVVAWVQHKQAKLAEDTAFDAAFAQALEIHYAVLDPAAGKVLRQSAITSDEVMDFNPQLARGQDGTLWLGWINSPGATLTGNASRPNQVIAARWDGAQWSAKETAFNTLVGALTWRLAAFDAGRALVAADGDTDGKLSTPTDREIFIAERGQAGWAAPRSVTANKVLDLAPLAAYTPEGDSLVAWASEGTLMGVSGDLQAAPQAWQTITDTTPLMNGVLLAGAGGERMLLWPDQTAAMDVQISRYDPASGKWSTPASFLGQPRQAASISAGITSAGDLVVGLAALDTITNTVTLSTGEAFEMPAQAKTAQLVVAGVKTSFKSQPPMAIEKLPPPAAAPGVENAPALPLPVGVESAPGNQMPWIAGIVLVCCCGLVVIGLAVGAFFFWRKAKKT